jgi:hypothetical protein
MRLATLGEDWESDRRAVTNRRGRCRSARPGRRLYVGVTQAAQHHRRSVPGALAPAHTPSAEDARSARGLPADAAGITGPSSVQFVSGQPSARGR